MTLAGLSDADHQELSRLVIETLWRIDHGKGDSTWELWTEDGVISYNGQPFASGREALKQWGDNRLPPDTVRHLATNLRFQADGPDAATGSGVEIVFHAPERKFGPEATLPQMLGEWDFRFVRTNQGWRFKFINFDLMFYRGEEAPELF